MELKEIEVSTRCSLDRFWKIRKAGPKSGRCATLHKSFSFPLAFASYPSRTRKSSLRASESAWISLSHLSQSFSDSHRTSSVNSSLGSLSISVLSSSTFDMVFSPDNISDTDSASPGVARTNNSYFYSACHSNALCAILSLHGRLKRRDSAKSTVQHHAAPGTDTWLYSVCLRYLHERCGSRRSPYLRRADTFLNDVRRTPRLRRASLRAIHRASRAMAQSKVKRGSVVIRYPFTDLTSAKVRPALVLTPDHLAPHRIKIQISDQLQQIPPVTQTFANYTIATSIAGPLVWITVSFIGLLSVAIFMVLSKYQISCLTPYPLSATSSASGAFGSLLGDRCLRPGRLAAKT